MDPFMFGVFLFILAFVVVVLRTIVRGKGAWRWVAFLPLVVLAVAVVNIVLHPASHNLLPFELIMWVVLGFAVLGIVAAARTQLLKIPKADR